MDSERTYAGKFLEESLGLAVGDIDAESVPSELVEGISSAMRGEATAASEEPLLERSIQEYGAVAIASIEEKRGHVLLKERWPGGARYASCLTHDVDNLSRPLSHIVRRRGRFTTSDFLLGMMGLRQLYDNISLVAGLESTRRLRSSFYLLTANYDLRRKSNQLNSLTRAGWDIGLHGDFGTHDSQSKMARALSDFHGATGIRPTGVREHFLKFDYGKTWGIMEELGFAYDTTVGNTDTLGFRLGLCTPFHPPDESWRPRRILELPLVLMDVTLWGYLKRTEEEGLGDFDRLKRHVAGVNGLFTILWHPEAARMKGGRIYPSLLDELLKDGCFIGSGRDITDWWSIRGRPLALEGNTYTMDDAPSGLVLRFKDKGGRKFAAEGGTVGVDGDPNAIKATGGPLRVRVS
ncbi:MAG: hypothetical protein LYZ69_00685 [Nitrososphaerales archaeon]|nr:hypothetical protein [Nitrososphaerales archaeon]